ncbi:MAG: hypothetical protein HRU07_05660 [Nitrosopumilus sp.]|nr:hypothetical protein [Nitrosopumilus sp.]NRA05632.1 hypothetical protein [Nitrosopumilus sp.]
MTGTSTGARIDNCIISCLKLHETTPKDLLNHAQNSISDAEITIDGINARLVFLHEEGQISPSEILGKFTWKIGGEPTVANKVWKIIVSLAKLECHIEKIIYTIRKQNPEITPYQIRDSVGILQKSGIIHSDENEIVIVSNIEKSFIQRRMNS